MVMLTDSEGCSKETSRERDIKFAGDMEKAGIPWEWYSGRCMYGRECPSACTSRRNSVSEEDIIRATKVKGLKKDNMGLDTVLYTG